MTKVVRRLVCAAAIAVLLTRSTLHAAACGDANDNGGVDAGDATLMLQFLGGLISGTSLCGGMGPLGCLDENTNGSVDTGDLVILLNVVAGNPVLFQCSDAPPIPCSSTLRGSVDHSITLAGDGCETFIDGVVFVQPGVVLGISPGAIIRARKFPSPTVPGPSMLVFLRGAKINAPGTAAEPIVLTSDQPPGQRAAGDWRGLMFNGRAPVNCPGGECIVEGIFGASFGGTVPNDTSGFLTYARIEFTGDDIQPDNVAVGLAMNAVGRSTTFNHIQVHRAFGDAFQWSGGTVLMKYLVASACGDDCFDWQLGYSGSVQYGLAIQSRDLTTLSGGHALEGDNNEAGYGFLPVSNPRFCNLTLLGTKREGDPGTIGRRGVLLRRGTGGKIWNTVVTGFAASGVRLENPETAQRACASSTMLRPYSDAPSDPSLELRNVVLHDNGPDDAWVEVQTGPGALACDAQQWLSLLHATNHVEPPLTSDIGPDPLLATGYIPAAGGPLDGAGMATSCQSLDPSWMDAKTYLGAFQPGNTAPGDAGDWLDPTSPWISFATD